MDKFEIQLSRHDLVYFPGDEVSGNLLIKTKDRMKINEILLELKGEAFVKWSTGSKSKPIHSSHDCLLEKSLVVLGKQTNELYLEPNEYNFPFKFTLPRNKLPTSFERNLAAQYHIRYFLKSTIVIPWSFNKSTLKCISVINTLDLNLFPALRQPYGVSDTKTLCCWFCKSDPINIEFNANKSGYVSGETVVFNVSIDNQSSSAINSILVSLVQHTEFIAIQSRRSSTTNIRTLIYNGPKIGPRMQGKWSDGKLKIPPVCPSLLETCSIIKLHYRLKLIVNVRGLSVNQRLDIPILIGTVPMNDSNTNLQNISSMNYRQSIINRQGMFKPKISQFVQMKQLKAIGDYKKETKFELDYFEPKYPYYSL